MFIQEWTGTIRDRERYECYSNFKSVFEKERYLLDTNTYCFRVAITRIRFNLLPLNNNLHRYSKTEKDKACPFCRYQVENEHHFLFQCSLYQDLRSKFLKEFASCPLHLLLKASSASHRHSLSRYIFHAINRRIKSIL